MSTRHFLMLSLPVRHVGFAALLALSIGCGGGPERQIHGVVTMDGKPLESGEIQFTPTGGSAGPTAGSTITNGAYFIPAVAQGVRAGNAYSVSISSMAGSGRMAPDPNAPTGQRELLVDVIPARYNTESILSITISADKSVNVFDFPLTSSAE